MAWGVRAESAYRSRSNASDIVAESGLLLGGFRRLGREGVTGFGGGLELV